MRNGYRLATIALIAAVTLAAQTSDSTEPQDPELQRLSALVEAGVIPAAQLDRAREEANRTRLASLVRDLLQKPELAPDEVTTLLRSVVELQKIEFAALRKQQELVSAGVASANSLVAFRDRVDVVDKQYELASSRARLAQEKMRVASAEDRLDELVDEELAFVSPGEGVWDEDILEIDDLFYEQFGERLPISAAGSTDLHISMGFDHTGRYDVALYPDDVEGLYLMALLEEKGIPYIAFRSAVPGQATGPHIHIGPPSVRVDAVASEEELDRMIDELLKDGSESAADR